MSEIQAILANMRLTRQKHERDLRLVTEADLELPVDFTLETMMTGGTTRRRAIEEGPHLRIHLIPLRRSQRTHDPAELLILLPGGHTQLHTHPDIEESIYVLAGTGVANWDAREVALGPGSALCYPPGVTRRIVNTGDSLLTYICHAASVV